MNFLSYSSKYAEKYVVTDQGREMPQDPATVSLFEKYGHAVRRTATYDSHQSSPAEGNYKYIRESVMPQVPFAILPYSLIHYIKIHGMAPHGE